MDVEKEESILKKEVKICMPYYKIAYSIAFVVILSAIQPVVYANEIGQAVERAVSLLAVVFCADTYPNSISDKCCPVLEQRRSASGSLSSLKIGKKAQTG